MRDQPLHPETPREIALCRMACDAAKTNLRDHFWQGQPGREAIMDKHRDDRYPLPKTRVPRVLTLDDGSEWTWEDETRSWLSRVGTNSGDHGPLRGSSLFPFSRLSAKALTPSELRRAADVRENPWTEGEG